ncbi:hypothetical protein FA15DRAFT_657337 [Coprinopsis marcescibilis]|uniref:F-box domain-containing protein n=1 Tax=Coprinopsis marcescibilis TaxID=230819 RepID=A0A5C3L3B3_COPMA|nr:hypothetical protein FA15DRAFT_657337 [Coprinopsis marcescibilis]
MGVTQSSSTGSTGLRLPSELYLMIADNLNSTDRNVHALSLLSETHHLANSVLYRTIVLDLCSTAEEANVNRLAATLIAKPYLALHIKDLTLIREGLESWTRHLAASRRRCLEPVPHHRNITRLRYSHFLQEYGIEERSLPAILTLALSVRKFSLVGLGGVHPIAPRWGDFKPELRLALQNMLLRPDVRHKSITRIRFFPQALLESVHAKELVLSVIDTELPKPSDASFGVEKLAGESEPSAAVAARKCERDSGSLELSMPSLSTMRFCASPAFLATRSIRSLVFSFFAGVSEGFACLQAILNHAAPTLADLSVSTHLLFKYSTLTPGWNWLVDGQLEVGSLCRLESIHISFKTWNRGVGGLVVGYGEWKWALDILKRLGARGRLKVIDLWVLWDDPDAELEGAHWEGWDGVLAGHVANGVKEIHFVFHGCKARVDGTPRGPDNVWRHLPSLGNELALTYQVFQHHAVAEGVIDSDVPGVKNWGYEGIHPSMHSRILWRAYALQRGLKE